LLYEDKLTIEGARMRLQDQSSLSTLLQEIETELQDLRSLLTEDS
jgi:hypothetical protein